MFAARGIDREVIPEEETEELDGVSESGRGFAYSGGVAQAVVNAIHEKEPGRDIKVAHADGLDECRKLLAMAKTGKYDGYLLEGMACPGGCVAGAGTLQPIDKSKRAVEDFAACASFRCFADTKYRKYLPLIEEKE